MEIFGFRYLVILLPIRFQKSYLQVFKNLEKNFHIVNDASHKSAKSQFEIFYILSSKNEKYVDPSVPVQISKIYKIFLIFV